MNRILLVVRSTTNKILFIRLHRTVTVSWFQRVVIPFTAMTRPQPSARAAADPRTVALALELLERTRDAATMPALPKRHRREHAKARSGPGRSAHRAPRPSRTRPARSRSHRHSSGDAWCAGQTSSHLRAGARDLRRRLAETCSRGCAQAPPGTLTRGGPQWPNPPRTSTISTRRATYQDVLDAPVHQVAEIIDGTLYTHPRPAPRHATASSVLGGRLGPPFHRGDGGPGGWRILDEPELHLGEEILVPTWPDGAGSECRSYPTPRTSRSRRTGHAKCFSASTRKLDLLRKRPDLRPRRRPPPVAHRPGDRIPRGIRVARWAVASDCERAGRRAGEHPALRCNHVQPGGAMGLMKHERNLDSPVDDSAETPTRRATYQDVLDAPRRTRSPRSSMGRCIRVPTSPAAGTGERYAAPYARCSLRQSPRRSRCESAARPQSRLRLVDHPRAGGCHLGEDIVVPELGGLAPGADVGSSRGRLRHAGARLGVRDSLRLGAQTRSARQALGLRPRRRPSPVGSSTRRNRPWEAFELREDQWVAG